VGAPHPALRGLAVDKARRRPYGTYWARGPNDPRAPPRVSVGDTRPTTQWVNGVVNVLDRLFESVRLSPIQVWSSSTPPTKRHPVNQRVSARRRHRLRCLSNTTAAGRQRRFRFRDRRRGRAGGVVNHGGRLRRRRQIDELGRLVERGVAVSRPRTGTCPATAGRRPVLRGRYFLSRAGGRSDADRSTKSAPRDAHELVQGLTPPHFVLQVGTRVRGRFAIGIALDRGSQAATAPAGSRRSPPSGWDRQAGVIELQDREVGSQLPPLVPVRVSGRG